MSVGGNSIGKAEGAKTNHSAQLTNNGQVEIIGGTGLKKVYFLSVSIATNGAYSPAISFGDNAFDINIGFIDGGDLRYIVTMPAPTEAGAHTYYYAFTFNTPLSSNLPLKISLGTAPVAGSVSIYVNAWSA